MYRKLIMLLLPIVFYTTAFAQEIKPLDNGGFRIDRDYAVLIASRFDSLIRCHDAIIERDSVLDTCLDVVSGYKTELRFQSMRADIAESSMLDLRNLNTNLSNTLDIQTSEIARLRLESKRKNKRKTAGGVLAALGGLGAGVFFGFLIAN